jgi:hypothetical protein
MAKNIDDVISKLPKSRQEQVKSRASELELKQEIQNGYDSAAGGTIEEWDINQFQKEVRAQALNRKNNKN